MNAPTPPLPPGQHERSELPRFGLPMFAHRFPSPDRTTDILINRPTAEQTTFGDANFQQLPRVTRRADFHCVTTWSVRDLTWSGVTFQSVLKSICNPEDLPEFVIVSAHDGYRACYLLEDLLGKDVLIADSLQGANDPRRHGVPYRLLVPHMYGYKNVKDIKRITFTDTLKGYRSAGLRVMEHLRARVDHEERANGIPGPLLRWPYRLMIGPTVWRFSRAWGEHME